MKLLLTILRMLLVVAIVLSVAVSPALAQPIPPADPYYNAVIANNPILYWRMSSTTSQLNFGNAGSYPMTMSGFGYSNIVGISGTTPNNVGLNYAAGYSNYGGTSYVIPTSVVRAGTTHYTFECWVYLPNGFSASGQDFCLVGNWSNAGSNGETYLGIVNGRAFLGCWDPDSFLSRGAQSGVLDTDKWHYLAGTISPSLLLYVDGVLAQNTPANSCAIGYDTVRSHNLANTSGDHALGMDELAIYNTALTQADVTNHWNGGSGPGGSGTGPQVNVTGRVCVRALTLDNGSVCNNGDIAGTRAVIGFSGVSASDAATIVCGHSACATTDNTGNYTYSTTVQTTTSLYWQFQGSGWCYGCAGQFRFNPAGGYGLTNITQSSTTGPNDFVVDANLYRGTTLLSGSTNPNLLLFVTTGAAQALTDIGVTLTPAQQTALQSAENAFASSFSIAPETVNTGFGRLISATGLGASVAIALTTFVFNPDVTGNAELWLPDTGQRISLAPQATTSVQLSPALNPSGLQVTTGRVVAVDTLTSPATQPTPQPFPTPSIYPTPIAPPTTTTPPNPSYDTTCDGSIFTLWAGLGPLLDCLFSPTKTLTDVLTVTQTDGSATDIPTALSTKVGFADFYELKTFICNNQGIDQPCDVSTGLFGYFHAGSWTGYIPWYNPQTNTVSNSVITWSLDSSNPIVQIMQAIVSFGIVLFSVGAIGSAVLGFFGVNPGGDEPLTEETNSGDNE